MRVAVTGNLGYIGPVVVRRLKEAGHTVVGIDTGWYLNEHVSPSVYPDVQHFGDIRYPRPSWTAGADAIVHLAGLSNDPMGDLDPDLTNEINFLGTTGMLVPGIRNLVISSCSVYGASPDIVSIESSPTNPLTAYARAKLAVDSYLGQMGDLVGISDWVSLRLGTVWGYSPGHRLDLVVNKMMHDALYTGKIAASGNASRPIVHVEDVADAVLFFLTAKYAKGVFNIVGENVRVYEVAEKVAAVADYHLNSWIGKRTVIEAQTPTADARDYRASNSRAYSLGWEPNYELNDGLSDLAILTANLPKGRTLTRLPIARKHLEGAKV